MLWYAGRHGLSVDNVNKTCSTDCSLSDKGRNEHAVDLGRLVRAVNPGGIDCGTYKRHTETADVMLVVGDYPGEYNPDPNLNEVCSGKSKGMSMEQVREMLIEHGLQDYLDMEEYDLRYMNNGKRQALVEKVGLEPIEQVQERRDTVIAQMKERAKVNDAWVSVTSSVIGAYIMEGLLYDTCGENISLREEGGFFPMWHDEVTIIDMDKDGKVKSIELNKKISDLISSHQSLS